MARATAIIPISIIKSQFGLVRVYIQEERTYYFPVSEQAGLVWYGCIYNGLNRTGALFNYFLIPKKKML